MSNVSDSPEYNEIEISVLGPGIGESILIHVCGKWIVIDSFLDPVSSQPAPLQYLTNLNINVSQDVELVVITHWHDDHMRGMNSVVRECRAAKVIISSALSRREFISLLPRYGDVSGGLREIRDVLRQLEGDNRYLFGIIDRQLLSLTLNYDNMASSLKVFALSPVDAGILRSAQYFQSFDPKLGSGKRRLIPLSPNNSSVVLLITIGRHSILLGADLEESSDSDCGWSVVLSNSTVLSNPPNLASAFKVPHHGSENAHCGEVWQKILTTQPFAVISPYRRGRKALPSDTDLNRISSLTSNVFVTSQPVGGAARFTDRMVANFVKEATKGINAISSNWGQVRLRKKISSADDSWEYALFGSARQFFTTYN
jgi:beta-lactamase superfamily II metal-dependent hydrolase